MESTGRPRGRFFCFCVLCALLMSVALPGEVWAAIPKTMVNDVLYRADGSPARGTVTIRWNAFTASDSSAIAAGVLAVKIGANGSFAVQLVPNTGAKPEGSYYKVVMKLDDGTTSEETWAVPQAPTTTVAAVRATVMPASAAVQYVGRDYVDTAVATAASNKVQTDASYADPVWMSSLSSSKLVGTLPAGILPANVATTTTQNTFTQPQTFANINGCRYAGQVGAGTIQAAINDAGTDGCVIIPKSYTGTDSFTNSGNIAIVDYRRGAFMLNLVDVRDYGAKCDGVTDDTAALQSAITAVGTKGGEIFIHGNPTACYIARPQSISWPTLSGVLKIRLRGTLKVGTTFTVPDSVDVVGDGGGGYPQFLGIGPTAAIQGLTTTGTLGTSFTAGTQTFTPSSMTGIYPGTGITVAGTVTCAISSVSRNANVVTATLGASCRIPPGAALAVAGVSDTSYNGTFFVAGSDYGLNTVTWNQTGSSSSSSGGTITGLNEDSVETVIITATTSTTATAWFQRAHSANDQFGVVVVATKYKSSGHKSIRNISVGGCGGACIWGAYTFYWGLYDVGANANQTMTSVPLVLSTSSSVTIRGGAYNAAAATTNPGLPWGIHFTEYDDGTGGYGNSTGVIDISDAWIQRGIKIDSGGISRVGMAWEVKLTRDTFERASSAVRVEPASNIASIGILQIDTPFVQDNLDGFVGTNLCVVSYTDYSNGKGGANINRAASEQFSCAVNKYFDGSLVYNGPDTFPLPQNALVSPGVLTNGRVFKAELDGIGAGFGPSLIPYATKNVTTNPSSWTCSNCTVTLVQGPDAVANSAGDVVSTGGNGQTSVWSQNMSTSTGDYFLYGAWVRPHLNTDSAASWAGAPFNLYSRGTDTIVGAQPSSFMMNIVGDWWHPVVGVAYVSAGQAASHAVEFDLFAGGSVGHGNQFFMPFVIYIPASANIPVDEIMRWRQQLLHGVVPPNLSGAALAVRSSDRLYFGSDTYIARGSAAGKLAINGTDISASSGSSAISSYPTCNGSVLPCRISLTGQTSSLGGQTLYTPTGPGTFRVSMTWWTMTAGTGGTVNANLNWNNGTTNVGTGWIANASLNDAASSQSYVRTIHASSGQSINVATSVSSPAGSPAYGLEVVIE